MPLGKEHKAQTRERIVRSAGRVFRQRGFAATGVADVMHDAGLTHGGFYAHFPSKEALFATVVGNDHGLIRQLSARPSSTPARWQRATQAILRAYLHPDHLAVVREGCTFAALTADAGRLGGPVQAAYETAFTTLVGELLRAPTETVETALRRASARRRTRAATLAAEAIGAVIVASGLVGPMRAVVLKAAQRQVVDGLARLR